jgi:diadenosine tetraphosphatase ApaH/serine/threonine PP2A family protein phosphatase
VRYLILSDIHGNVHALDAVLEDATRHACDRVLCLGDLVGYGADPAAVIARVRELTPVGLIRGNHDKVCAGIEPAASFNLLAKLAAQWTHDVLSPTDLEWLAALPKGPLRIESGLEICHGAPFNEDHYIFDRYDAMRSLDSTTARVCLFGHTHVPAIFAPADQPEHWSVNGTDCFRLPAGGQVLANVGSVGQPRDGDPRAAYGVIDTDTFEIELCRVPYDVEGAQAAIRKAGLPEWLAARLARGE